MSSSARQRLRAEFMRPWILRRTCKEGAKEARERKGEGGFIMIKVDI